MKFHLQSPSGNVITGAGEGWIRIGQQEYRESVVLTAEAVHPGFGTGRFDSLTREDFAGLLRYSPQIVLLGTGTVQRFPHPRLTQDLTAANVGLEVMDTRAACRTFNILVAEGRTVVGALLVE